jgi:formate transporter
LPVARLIRDWAPEAFWKAIGNTPADFSGLTIAGMIGNLVPVTIGNIVGGGVLVGAVYWFVCLRRR